jgi:hypothetical protein
MKSIRVLAAASTLVVLSASSIAQTGTLDQVSPFASTTTVGQSAGYNGDAPSLIWQCQATAGLTGQLEGVTLELSGAAGAQIFVGIRIGAGWNTSPTVFQTQVTKATSSSQEHVFVNMTSANIQMSAGNSFVIELQGNSTGCGMSGTYVPPPGVPAYPDFLFLNGPGCFADCGWRVGFETYVIGGASTPTVYCTSGTTVHGCTASISASANPRVGYNSPCQVTVNNVEGQKNGIVFYGLTQFIQPWCTAGGSSFLCVKPPTMRTGVQSTGGTANSCNGTLSLDWNAFQLANPGALGAPWVVGEKAFVQGWFRDPGNCKPTSLSNAVELTYLP